MCTAHSTQSVPSWASVISHRKQRDKYIVFVSIFHFVECMKKFAHYTHIANNTNVRFDQLLCN